MWVDIAWLVISCEKARCEKTSIKDIFRTYTLMKRDKVGQRITIHSGILNFITFGIWMQFVFAAEPQTGFDKLKNEKNKRNLSSRFRSRFRLVLNVLRMEHEIKFPSTDVKHKELAYAWVQNSMQHIQCIGRHKKATKIIDACSLHAEFSTNLKIFLSFLYAKLSQLNACNLLCN